MLTVFSTSVLVRETIHTLAPSADKDVQIPFPIPLAPPVTNTFFPLNLTTCIFSNSRSFLYQDL